MKLIIYPQENNQIAVITPVNNVSIDDVIQLSVPPNTPYKVVNTLNIDNLFFNAYDFDQELGAIINIDKAKEIQKNRWRVARKPLLETLDVEFMRALEAGDTQKQQTIANKKQALRDVTNTPLPDDLEGIKNTWPSILDL